LAISQIVASAVLVAPSCGVRAPSRIDVTALMQARGQVEARRELEVRIVADPKDLSARLGLAAVNEQTGRPSGAIAQLEAVIAIGGPIGTRWRDDDRARLARLLVARGRARLVRGAASAHADLVRARAVGAKLDDLELARARLALAIDQLRHVDAELRARGRRTLAELTGTPIAEPAWRGAVANAALEERGAFGVWLWKHGARREAWEQLHAWHDATTPPRDPAIAPTYLEARTWWTPIDAPPPDPSDLVGPQRCRYANVCSAIDLARGEPRDHDAITALFASPRVRTTAPADAVAWLTLTLARALRGEVAWGPTLATRVDLTGIATSSIAAPVRAAFVRIAGRGDANDVVVAELSSTERLIVAAGRALRGAPVAEVRAALGPVADSDAGLALLRVVTPASAEPIAQPYATAVVAHVRARVTHGPEASALRRMVDGYLRDPAIADRIAVDIAAEAVDAARAHAAIGATYDALGDPARARAAWQAAVDGSAELEHLRGLAEATARVHDPDAALVAATRAAAASGDPAVVWVAIARALEGTGEHQHALEAARLAIDLASADLLDDALAIAIAASRSLGRGAQANVLAARRAALAPPGDELAADPTDSAAALAEHRQQATVSSIARLWVASRWNPRDVAIRDALRAGVPADDPRHAVIVAELVGLASDRDSELGRAAVAALR
jgi:tetratricopeptide (TPR) repeat protein